MRTQGDRASEPVILPCQRGASRHPSFGKEYAPTRGLRAAEMAASSRGRPHFSRHERAPACSGARWAVLLCREGPAALALARTSTDRDRSMLLLRLLLRGTARRAPCLELRLLGVRLWHPPPLRSQQRADNVVSRRDSSAIYNCHIAVRLEILRVNVKELRSGSKAE